MALRLLAFLLLVSCAWAGVSGKVVGVHDGDTLTVLTEDKTQVKVRLWGIDAPEIKQDFGRKARETLEELTAGKNVEIEADKSDRYGRIVSKVTLSDGKDAGSEMLRAGYAWHYVRYAPEAEDYGQLEKEAREARRGLWQDLGTEKEPVAPWEWREHAKTGRS
jgi:micrococcal nuclease